jgi:hypothetical protein
MSADYAANLAKTAELDKLYRDEQVLRKKYWNMLEDMKGKIRVFARCRPMSDKELVAGNHSVVNFPDDMTIDLQSEKGQKSFVFDSCFGPSSTQVHILFVQYASPSCSSYHGFSLIARCRMQFSRILKISFNRLLMDSMLAVLLMGRQDLAKHSRWSETSR